MLPNTEKQTAAAKGYQQQSRGALPTKHLNASKKKKKEKFHLQVLPLLIKHFLVSKKKCLLKHALETRYINTTNFQSQSQGAALWRGEHRAWHKSRAGHFLESEWTRHRWGMSDATAKDDSRSSALKYKVNILYPPTAKWANDSQHAGSACL